MALRRQGRCVGHDRHAVVLDDFSVVASA